MIIDHSNSNNLCDREEEERYNDLDQDDEEDQDDASMNNAHRLLEDITFPTIQDLADIAKDLTLKDTEITKRENIYEKDFQRWKFYLASNHSLLLYGLGSKKNLLTKFAQQCLQKDGDTMIIDGFVKEVTIEEKLDITFVPEKHEDTCELTKGATFAPK